MIPTIFSKLKSLLFLNGSIDRRILSLLPLHLPMIAADGAANKLLQLEITPTFIVGDGDSFDSLLFKEAKMIKIEEQETTDFQKSLLFAQNLSLTPTLVLGMNGGEIDHILGNAIVMLRQPAEVELYFLDGYEKQGSFGMKLGLLLTKEKKMSFTLPPKSLLSILSMEKTILTTHGLKWELNHTLIEPNGLLSLRNENLSPEVDFEVEIGKALLIIDIPG